MSRVNAAIVLIATVALGSCGSNQRDQASAIRLSEVSLAQAVPAESEWPQTQRLVDIKAFTSGFKMLPAPDTSLPKLAVETAYLKVREEGLAPGEPNPIAPSQVLLGLFDADQSTPDGQLVFGFLFQDVAPLLPAMVPGVARSGTVPPPVDNSFTQDRIVFVDAATGVIVLAISGGPW